MKKIICSLLLAFALVFAVACDKYEVDLNEVYASVFEDVDLLKVTENLTLPTEVEGVSITWTSSNPDVISNEGVVTRQDTDVIVTLTAVLTVEGQDPLTIDQRVKVLKKEADPTKVWAPIQEFAVGTYKFALYQKSAAKTLYLNGEMSGYYMATTENAAEAIDVEVVAVTGGYQLKTSVQGAVKYIEAVTSADGQHVNVVYSDEATVVWTWNAELMTFTTPATYKGEEGTYYLGTYGTYMTFSASTVDKAPTSYVGHLYKQYEAGSVVYPPVEAETVTTIAAALAAEDGTKAVLQGTVKSVDSEWSDLYSNMCVTITDGTNDIYLYRITLLVNVGDVIKVEGRVSTYNDQKQIGQGSTTTMITDVPHLKLLAETKELKLLQQL